MEITVKVGEKFYKVSSSGKITIEKLSDIEKVSDRFHKARKELQNNPKRLTSLQRRMQSGDY
jgi:uncharacterized membrane protein YjjP (DUF1212 family)